MRDFFIRIDRATLAQSHHDIEFYPQLPHAPSSSQSHQQPTTANILDRMSADEILQLSRALGTAGAQAFLKMLVRDNFVHVSSLYMLIAHAFLPSSLVFFRLIYTPAT